ncbi:MAG: hypothetical protein M3Q71_19485 [Chloroflexota bacterium]|nr:hypothetical protein [Chloroflexota bacterium]
MSAPTPDWSGPSMPSYQKLAGEVDGLIESVKHLTARVATLEQEVAELRAGGELPGESGGNGGEP